MYCQAVTASIHFISSLEFCHAMVTPVFHSALLAAHMRACAIINTIVCKLVRIRPSYAMFALLQLALG